MEGPTELPFDHDDVCVYVDTLFLEGHLKPIEHQRSSSWARTWAAVGLQLDPQVDCARRLRGFLDAVKQSIPGEQDRHGEWLAFALQWAELLALRHSDGPAFEPDLLQRLASVHDRVEQWFANWLFNRYGGLHNQPAVPPVMLHHLPRHLSRRQSIDVVSRVVLVVIDGLSLDQWVAIRQELISAQGIELEMREGALFAWVPTLTLASRQAIFDGKPPLLFGGSLFTTDKEQEPWRQFWLVQGLPANEVGYARGLGSGPLTLGCRILLS